MPDESKKVVFSNVGEFYAILQQSLAVVREDVKKNRKPNADGSGFVLTWDSKRKGFRAAFVAIIFAGVFLEATLHLLIAGRLGAPTAKKHDGDKYEEKLLLLGCADPAILDLCKNYRDARREVVHEKAYQDDGPVRGAQDEAEAASTLVEKVIDYFGVRKSLRP